REEGAVPLDPELREGAARGLPRVGSEGEALFRRGEGAALPRAAEELAGEGRRARRQTPAPATTLPRQLEAHRRVRRAGGQLPLIHLQRPTQQDLRSAARLQRGRQAAL